MTLKNKLMAASKRLSMDDFQHVTGVCEAPVGNIGHELKSSKEVEDFALNIATVIAVYQHCPELMLPRYDGFILSCFVSFFELGRAFEQVDSLERLVSLESEEK